jgi:hypothetical protein
VPPRLKAGVEVVVPGLAPNSEEVAGAAGVVVLVADGIVLDVEAGAAGVAPNSEGVAAFGCSAGLVKLKRLPLLAAGCVLEAGGALAAGVVDCAAGVVDAV